MEARSYPLVESTRIGDPWDVGEGGSEVSGALLRQWWGSWSRELREARREERQLGWEGSFRLV